MAGMEIRTQLSLINILKRKRSISDDKYLAIKGIRSELLVTNLNPFYFSTMMFAFLINSFR